MKNNFILIFCIYLGTQSFHIKENTTHSLIKAPPFTIKPINNRKRR